MQQPGALQLGEGDVRRVGFHLAKRLRKKREGGVRACVCVVPLALPPLALPPRLNQHVIRT